MSAPIVDSHSLLHLVMEARWESDGAEHTEIRHFEKFNVWRDCDLLPAQLQGEIVGRPAGHRAAHEFGAGTLVPAWDRRELHRLPLRSFQPHSQCGGQLEPRVGRFYPQGFVEGIAGVYPESMQPLRLVGLDAGWITVDLNHPIARFPLEVGVEIRELHGAPEEHGGRCNDTLDELLHGPGMQARHAGEATDLFSGEPFRRTDEGSDHLFYSLSRMVQHLDSAAIGEVERLYGRLIPQGGRVLDLMASWDSHLPADLSLGSITGLGMNSEELDANGRLTERVVQDLNQRPELPFADGAFDVVVCTVSVEYLARPIEVFREVGRVLRPGGIFVNTFSNRWFPTKAIALWVDLHEFERLGLVTEYYRQAGGFEGLHTLSLRGLPRPEDDPHRAVSPWSDPLYAVWGRRTA